MEKLTLYKNILQQANMFVNTEKIHTISFFKIRGKWIENIKTQIIVITYCYPTIH